MMPAAPVTRIDLFTVPTAEIPRALLRMAADRRRLARAGPWFWKLLGTGDGRTFDVRDADLRRWGVVTVWPTLDAARRFAEHPVVTGWQRLATEHWWAAMRAVRAIGAWSRRQPFGPPFADAQPGAPLAALTRARLRWSMAPRFWRSVAAVNTDLDRAEGLLLRMGVGEAPLGLQGTFSLWHSPAAMHAFAYRRVPHRHVIRRSAEERWYREELFARFTITDAGGTIFGRDPLAARSAVED